MNPLPVASPIAAGVFWSYLVPAALLVVSVGSTWWLYRRFSKENDTKR
ncbi:MAG: hypothetical protein HY700_00370 [Gemmatimonadetes bacterium]|nr:hypothetical protein [Gemmatimonadota bacterium]